MRYQRHAVALSTILITTFSPCAGEGACAQGSLPAVSALTWREIGPARVGGHINDLAVVEHSPGVPAGTIMYAASSGGLFRSSNRGDDWEPVFDGEMTSTVNAVAVAPSQPSLVWVGTGDPDEGNIGINIPGLGLFRSKDYGAHWAHVGLSRVEYISRIAVHPLNADIVYVAALGSLTRSSLERGVYKTTDGGRHWTQVLFVNGWTGAIDIILNPADPNTIYAAMWQQALRPEAQVRYGAGSGLYKSTDGGGSWRKLTDGLPIAGVGRSSVAVSRADPNVVYAVLDVAAQRNHRVSDTDEESVVYRSTDRGEHWERGASLDGSQPGYLGRIFADPTDANRIFVAGDQLQVSRNGGKTLRVLPSAQRGMPDPHTLWIDPLHANHIVVGNDYGIFITEDAGNHWRHIEKLSLGQFFAVDVDRRWPFYRVYGTSRDHAGMGGPAVTPYAEGISNTDWFSTGTVEAYGATVDPEDPNTVYFAMPGMIPARYDVAADKHTPIGSALQSSARDFLLNIFGRVVVSSRDHNTIYIGTTRLFRSPDRGDHWQAISSTLAPSSPESVRLMGSMHRSYRDGLYQATITTIAESPLDSRVLYAGTQGGQISITRDGGTTWQVAAPLPSVPAQAMITRVIASSLDRGTAYATANAVTLGSVRPYVFRTIDYGAHWVPIVTGLPTGATVWAIAQHPRSPSLLFLGTDVGVFVTTDGGDFWQPLRLNMPAVSVRDLVLQVKTNDLVVCTWGRGVWVLDDITPLEHLGEAARARAAYLFPVRPALAFRPRDRYGVSGIVGEVGLDYAAPNPPLGAIISYAISAGVKNVRAAVVDVVDSAGRQMRSIPVLGVPGLHRVVWNLRTTPSTSNAADNPHASGERADQLVAPGTYRVRLRLSGVQSAVGVIELFQVEVPAVVRR